MQLDSCAHPYCRAKIASVKVCAVRKLLILCCSTFVDTKGDEEKKYVCRANANRTNRKAAAINFMTVCVITAKWPSNERVVLLLLPAVICRNNLAIINSIHFIWNFFFDSNEYRALIEHTKKSTRLLCISINQRIHTHVKCFWPKNEFEIWRRSRTKINAYGAFDPIDQKFIRAEICADKKKSIHAINKIFK